MTCPNCKKESLKEINFQNIHIDKCGQCQGIWFEQDELRKVKDEKDENLKWLDIDLWKEKEKLKVSPFDKLCPTCQIPFFEVEYGNSGIKTDICDKCKGVWLDKGEFRKIISYLKEKVSSDTLNKYFNHTLGQAKEIVTGPEKLSSEIEDFFLVSKLLQYRLYAQYPKIKELILHLPFTK